MKHASSQINEVRRKLLAVAGSSAFTMCGFVGTGLAAEPVFDGGKSTWHDGFVRYDFTMDDGDRLAITPFTEAGKEGFAVGSPAKGQRRCIVVVPDKPAPGNPWSWRGCYWDHQPQTETGVAAPGFLHCVHYARSGAGSFPGGQWDAWCTPGSRRSMGCPRNRPSWA